MLTITRSEAIAQGLPEQRVLPEQQRLQTLSPPPHRPRWQTPTTTIPRGTQNPEAISQQPNTKAVLR